MEVWADEELADAVWAFADHRGLTSAPGAAAQFRQSLINSIHGDPRYPVKCTRGLARTHRYFPLDQTKRPYGPVEVFENNTVAVDAAYMWSKLQQMHQPKFRGSWEAVYRGMCRRAETHSVSHASLDCGPSTPRESIFDLDLTYNDRKWHFSFQQSSPYDRRPHCGCKDPDGWCDCEREERAAVRSWCGMMWPPPTDCERSLLAMVNSKSLGHEETKWEKASPFGPDYYYLLGTLRDADNVSVGGCALQAKLSSPFRVFHHRRTCV